MKRLQSMRILGIDPGTNLLGFAVLHVNNNEVPTLHKMDVIDLRKLQADQKLGTILLRTQQLMETYLPTHIAVEAPFYGKNAQSMLKLGRVQGIIIGVGLSLNIPVEEYAPRTVKQYTTGRGSASKQVVANTLRSLFQMQYVNPKFSDESDALAVSYCHFLHLTASSMLPSLSSQKDAISPKRTTKNRRQQWTTFIKKVNK